MGVDVSGFVVSVEAAAETVFVGGCGGAEMGVDRGVILSPGGEVGVFEEMVWLDCGS